MISQPLELHLRHFWVYMLVVLVQVSPNSGVVLLEYIHVYSLNL